MAPLRVSTTKSEWLPDDPTAFVPTTWIRRIPGSLGRVGGPVYLVAVLFLAGLALPRFWLGKAQNAWIASKSHNRLQSCGPGALWRYPAFGRISSTAASPSWHDAGTAEARRRCKAFPPGFTGMPRCVTSCGTRTACPGQPESTLTAAGLRPYRSKALRHKLVPDAVLTAFRPTEGKMLCRHSVQKSTPSRRIQESGNGTGADTCAVPV